ncbi:MAG: diguanylate cyclase [Rhodoferax sp.]|nr:diguanylate cyclase [Rhodoferax sp.]
MAYRKNPVGVDELRALAQKRFFDRPGHMGNDLSQLDVQHLFEELEIHQIELEMQNEHLNATRAQLESTLIQNSELYDFAPVGILSLDLEGVITKLNLAGARMLGGERARLLGTRFKLYVREADRPVFDRVVGRTVATGDVQDGELELSANGSLPRHAEIRVAQLPQAQGFQLILVDITRRRQVEDSLRVSEERWKLALEAAGDGVWDWNLQTSEVVFSEPFEALFGFAPGEYGHRIEDWNTRIHPDDRRQVLADIQAHLSGKTPIYSNEHRGLCKDGSWKWVLSRGAVITRTDEGRALRMLGTHSDVTSRKQTEEDLRESNRFQQAVFDSLVAHIVVLDHEGVIVMANTAWRNYALENCKNHGHSGELIGMRYLDVLACITHENAQTLAAASAGLASVMDGRVAQFQLEHPFFTPFDARWFSMKVTSVHDAARRIVVSHEDVTSLKAAELASLTLANVDMLTGALSRRNFLNLADQELARSNRYGLPLMVLMLDLDHFKSINDRFGHAAGDKVLQGFVTTVTDVLRESDLIGRLGGEEFAVLLPNTTMEGGRALAQRIIDSVRDSTVEVGGQRIPYTVSVGAGCLSGENNFAALLAQADAALYRAKESGRDRLEVSLS